MAAVQTAFERLRQTVAAKPLRVMSADELYELARDAMNDRELHHPGRCRRVAAQLSGAERCPAEGRYNRCNLRCDMSYWHAHGNVIGNLMARLARRIGKDPNLYMATGVLSTIDYLAHPHDLGDDVDAIESHPSPLVHRLLELDAPRSMVLAVLEAPEHTGLAPSAMLGHALRVCAAAAACLEAEREFPLPDDAGELREVLEDTRGLRLVAHSDLAVVERERLRKHTRESCSALALAIRTKDAKRAERTTRAEVRQGLAEALAEQQSRRRPGQGRNKPVEGEAFGAV